MTIADQKPGDISAGYQPAAILLNTDAGTLPAQILIDALREIRGLYNPRIFDDIRKLDGMITAVNNSSDAGLFDQDYLDCLQTARGLAVSGHSIARDLEVACLQLNINDESQLTEVSRTAQLVGYSAIRLRKSLNKAESLLANIADAPLPPGPRTVSGNPANKAEKELAPWI